MQCAPVKYASLNIGIHTWPVVHDVVELSTIYAT